MTEIPGRRVSDGCAIRLGLRDGLFAQISPVDDCKEALPWVGPGLVDLQVNGHGGIEFTDPELTVDQVECVNRAMVGQGVVAYLPTVTTHSFEVLRHALTTLAASRTVATPTACAIAGFHLEGPYISLQDGPRGAHPVAHCRAPSWDEFARLQAAAGGNIRILTMSPEWEAAAKFIRRVVDSGVVVAIGHTAASSEQIKAAVDSGASMSTHLGNGAHGQIRRHPNYLWDQLADDRLTASLIADGHHLPAAVIQTFLRAKTLSRIVLVSDITGMAGMPPGRYENASLGAVEVLEDGRLVVAGQRQYLAGAALPMHVGISNLMRMAQVPLADAYRLASSAPAALIGLPASELNPGQPANFTRFEIDDAQGINVVDTWVAGQRVFRQ